MIVYILVHVFEMYILNMPITLELYLSDMRNLKKGLMPFAASVTPDKSVHRLMGP